MAQAVRQTAFGLESRSHVQDTSELHVAWEKYSEPQATAQADPVQAHVRTLVQLSWSLYFWQGSWHV